MTAHLDRPATTETLMLWVMHRFSEKFDQEAILKGGMALRLLQSTRATNDIDYVFVPYTSKNDIRDMIESTLNELEGAAVNVALHSKMLRAQLVLDGAQIQIEANVAPTCPSTAMSTGDFAREHGKPPRVLAVMDLDRALTDKLSAWNERRLLRDLYDVHFLLRVGAKLDRARLAQRLATFESRLPSLRQTKSMSHNQLRKELEAALDQLNDDAIRAELGPLLPPDELPGLTLRLRATLAKLTDQLDVPNR